MAARTVFLDTNIILEGKPLQDLPWADLDSNGSILVLVTPTVLKEVDSKKRDGRLGEKARSFNRLIAPAATNGSTLVLREAAPRVELAVARCGRIDWDALPALDPTEPDARVVAEVLAAVDVPAAEKMLVSQDVNPLAMAYAAGVRTHHVSTDWLAPKEPSPAEKEISRLKQKVGVLETTQPKLTISIDAPPGPMTVRAVQPMNDAQKSALLRKLLKKTSAAGREPLIGGIMHDYGYKRRLETFRERTVPAFVETFGEKLSLSYAQAPFTVRVANAGPLRADRLIVQITSEGANIYDRWLLTTPLGPPAPQPRFGMDHLVQSFARPAALIGKHEIHLEVEPELGGRLIEAHCEDFRHGREWVFEGVLTLDPFDPKPARLKVSASASNLHGQVQEEVVIAKQIVPTTVTELMDLDTGRPIVDPPMWSKLESAITAHDLSAFVFAGADPDD